LLSVVLMSFICCKILIMFSYYSICIYLGISVGMCWKFRIQCSEEGVHRPHVAGISGKYLPVFGFLIWSDFVVFSNLVFIQFIIVMSFYFQLISSIGHKNILSLTTMYNVRYTNEISVFELTNLWFFCSGQAEEGCQSLVLAGGYEDDTDDGFEFIYTGSGGRDLSGNRRTAEQSSDQVRLIKWHSSILLINM